MRPTASASRVVKGTLTADRKSTRLNSSHQIISYAVFCLKKKKHTSERQPPDHIVCRLLLDKTTTYVRPRPLSPDSIVPCTACIASKHSSHPQQTTSSRAI